MRTVTPPSSPAVHPEAGLAPAAIAPHLRRDGPIVVATDGVDHAPAVDTAVALARQTGRPLVILSIIEPPASALGGFGLAPAWTPHPTLYPTLVAARREQVARQVDALGVAGVPLTLDVVVEEPSFAIAEEARLRRASMIVVGIGRHDLATRLLGGEVATRTIRRADTPVLAVGDAPCPLPARVAVAAIDFSPSSLLAARAARDLLAEGGTLYLVHAWTPSPLAHPVLAEADEAYMRALPGRLARLTSALSDARPDVVLRTEIRKAPPVEAVLDVARAEQATLVAAGRQGLGRLERLLVGHVTTALLRHSSCALLVTPPPTPLEREAAELALGGTSESREPAEWGALLEAFARRNGGRATVLEVDDPAIGAQVQARGYALVGATYDPADARVELMLGTTVARAVDAPHLTREIGHVRELSTLAAADGRDAALRIRHGEGQTLLTFLPG